MNYKRLFQQNGYIFITIVTYNRNPILIENIDILKNSFSDTKLKYSFELIAIVVNYDHLHFIIHPKNIEDYPKIIGSIKRYFTKHIEKEFINNKFETNVWQKRYWEHTIRDENDLYRHIDYIHYNPMKHYNIPPKNWEFSSFNKFVTNGYYEIGWCNFEDKYNISELECGE